MSKLSRKCCSFRTKQNWSKRSLAHGPALGEPITSPHPCYSVSGHSRQPMESIFPEQSYSVISSPCLKCKNTELKVSEPEKGTLLCEMLVPLGFSFPVVPMAGFWSIKHTNTYSYARLTWLSFMWRLPEQTLCMLSLLLQLVTSQMSPQTRRRPGEMELWGEVGLPLK